MSNRSERNRKRRWEKQFKPQHIINNKVEKDLREWNRACKQADIIVSEVINWIKTPYGEIN